MTMPPSEGTHKKVSPLPLILSGVALWGAASLTVHHAFFDTEHPFVESVAQASIAALFTFVFYLAHRVELEIHR